MTPSEQSLTTLLLVGSRPGSGNVGGLLLEDMLAAAPAGEVLCAAVVGGERDGQEAEGRDEVVSLASPGEESAWRPWAGRVGSLVGSVRRSLTVGAWLRQAERRVAELIRQRGIERLWVICDAPAVIELAERVQARSGLPLLTQVWDDPAYVCQNLGLDRLSRGRVLRSFAQLLRRSERTGVICEAMAQDYAARYGAKCCVVRQGLAEASPARVRPASEDEFRIGISGSLYCASAWASLLEALDRLEWRLAGKPVRLRVLASDVRLQRRGPANIEFLGWRSQAEVSTLLGDCDLTYLPQPFEPHLSELARLSFPTKLSAYVAVGRPVFIHAPPTASVPEFCKGHLLGPVCTSIDPAPVARTLSTFCGSPESYAAAANGAAEAARGVLSRETFLEQLENFLALGVPRPTPAMNLA